MIHIISLIISTWYGPYQMAEVWISEKSEILRLRTLDQDPLFKNRSRYSFWWLSQLRSKKFYLWIEVQQRFHWKLKVIEKVSFFYFVIIMRFLEVLYSLLSHKSSCQRIKRSISVWKSQTNIHTKIVKVFEGITFKLDRRQSDNMRSSLQVLKWFYCRDVKECFEWMSYVKIEGKWRYVTSHSSLTQLTCTVISSYNLNL